MREGCSGSFSGLESGPCGERDEEKPLTAGSLRVGMQMEAPRLVSGSKAGAGPVPGRRSESKHDLGHQLFPDRDFAPTGKPQLHGANIINRALAFESSFTDELRAHGDGTCTRLRRLLRRRLSAALTRLEVLQD